MNKPPRSSTTIVLAGASAAIQFAEAVQSGGKAFYEAADAMGLEGIVSKLARASYVSGRKQDECRWPVSHTTKALGGYLFCGRQIQGHSYCAKHQLLNPSTRKN